MKTKSIFERELYFSFKRLGLVKKIWFSKFYDTPPLRRGNRIIYLPKNPFDFFCITENYFYGIEAKMIREKRFPFAMLPEHQEQNLIKFNDVNEKTKAYIFINFKLLPEKNIAFAIDINKYLILKEKYMNEGLRGIPLESFENDGFAIQLERLRFDKNIYGWELKEVVK
ncbi:MAG: hypothetical protein DRM99_02390 [Thermoplasmata archaeon]|nr:MAG: hypothetical protein DRM99_02390 [Thermoplasmata archaeon]